MKTPKDFAPGDQVVYKTRHHDMPGVVKSISDKWVFVVYHCDKNWDRYFDYTAAATDPNHLSKIEGK